MFRDIIKYYKAGSRVCFLLIFTVIVSSCTSLVRFSSGNNSGSGKIITGGGTPVEAGTVIRGKASFYGDEFQGRTTSNGEIYDRNKISAAHKTLPFGTVLKVRNLNNNRVVIVRINDRGPFAPDRILDLSYTAAKELDMIKDGVIDVEITVME